MSWLSAHGSLVPSFPFNGENDRSRALFPYHNWVSEHAMRLQTPPAGVQRTAFWVYTFNQNWHVQIYFQHFDLNLNLDLASEDLWLVCPKGPHTWLQNINVTFSCEGRVRSRMLAVNSFPLDVHQRKITFLKLNTDTVQHFFLVNLRLPGFTEQS